MPDHESTLRHSQSSRQAWISIGCQTPTSTFSLSLCFAGMRIVKLHGAFRSGSNYVKALLELNYEVSVVNGHGGFKHTPITAIFEGREWIPPPDPILGVVKNPWAWLVSNVALCQ